MDIEHLIIQTAVTHFNISMLKPYQLLVVSRIVEQDLIQDEENKNQIVILPTGTGKSLCFLLPSLLCKGITVIVYPLLALMNDQINKLKKNKIDCVCLRGGQTKAQRKDVFYKLKKGTKILITNPETLNQEEILKKLKKLNISLFVCDEAHVISQWGKSFRPAYNSLSNTIKVLQPKQIVAFTATATDEILLDIKKCLFVKDPLIIRGDSDRENIFYQSYPVSDRDFGVFEILKICEKPAIVFCNSRNITYKLCTTCKRIIKDIPSMYYHAGLSKTERENIEKWFSDSDNGVLFATCAYGMGIDKDNIRTTIHHTLPSNIAQFLQETGRAGRDRKQSISYAIVTPSDKATPLVKIFKSDQCRRKQLLLELGEKKEECSGCDICAGTNVNNNCIEDLIVRIVKRHPFKYTITGLAAILCGSRDLMECSYAMRTDVYYNTLQDYDQDQIEKLIKNLTATRLKSINLFRKLGILLPRPHSDINTDPERHSQ